LNYKSKENERQLEKYDSTVEWAEYWNCEIISDINPPRLAPNGRNPPRPRRGILGFEIKKHPRGGCLLKRERKPLINF